ncbi:glycosyl transferase family 1 [Mesorhizobium sp. Root552]|uniref:glycosyltransferase n=1 Tax=Mesorhizobium sp. Root552 TaxID=1736555 RepID=UPI0006F2E56E|nr:glycosyltransferase [Mesorhizobium sp. Root552]KQZ28519.1 glycosyl transferase family 1 [Mesorhizobium sp. Root552]
MKIWLVRDLEPLPTDLGAPRLMRAGMLARTLASRGHQTTWFTSTFNHYSKTHRVADDQWLRAGENLTIRVFRAPGYRHNISFRRILHNRCFAEAFRRYAAASEERPDVLVTDLPTTEAAKVVVAFGLRARIPTVVSIRDLWPDFFVDFLPPRVRPLARMAILPLDAQARFACRHATALVGISERYLAWGQAKGTGRTAAHDRVFPLTYRRLPPEALGETEAVLTKFGILPGKQVVAFVGSWGATYDLDYVLETCRLLLERDDILFVLAGDASSRPDLIEAFRALPNVVLPGWIDSYAIAALLGRATIGLLPYVSKAPQGLPNKVFEYMAYGTYQMATLGGEITGLYAETGIGRSMPGASPAAFAAAIETALADPETLHGRERRVVVFEERFDADKIYAKMVEHIVDVASGRVR